jgi:hypothetical protein
MRGRESPIFGVPEGSSAFTSGEGTIIAGGNRISEKRQKTGEIGVVLAGSLDLTPYFAPAVHSLLGVRVALLEASAAFKPPAMD